MLRLLRRVTKTAVKLPLAMAWDVISLGNMGDGSSTVKVLDEHQDQKYIDDVIEVVERIKEMRR